VFVSEAIFCTTQQLHYQFAYAAVLSSENASEKKSTIYTSSLKEGFFVGYIIRKRGCVFSGHSRKAETIEYV